MIDISNRVEVIFRISGLAMDISALNEKLKIIEGKVTHRRESIPIDAMPEAWWAVNIKMFNQESTEDSILKILDKIEPVREVLSEIADDVRFKIQLDCEIIIYDDRPMIEVSAKTVRRIANVYAELGFEVFDYRE